MIARAVAVSAAMALFALASPALAGPDDLPGATERAEIDFLLQTVERSPNTFIRNGKEHDGQEAARHMRRKFEHYRDKGEIRSADDFIRLAGTGSLISGRPYEVRLEDGSEIHTSVWLKQALAGYRVRSGDGAAGRLSSAGELP
jgi:hypothetical protein